MNQQAGTIDVELHTVMNHVPKLLDNEFSTIPDHAQAIIASLVF